MLPPRGRAAVAAIQSAKAASLARGARLLLHLLRRAPLLLLLPPWSFWPSCCMATRPGRSPAQRVKRRRVAVTARRRRTLNHLAMSARTTGSFCSHTVQLFSPPLRGAVSAPTARRMSLLDDAGIFTRMLLMEAREQAKSGGRPSRSPQASGHRGERVITSKRPPWNSGTAVPRTLFLI